ncbi:MAG TPA: phage tail length tape measure family protein, partial [Tianweitania sediminis]|nr:phage tail length tape measure family protein [Tianweitania sediminis]
MAQSAVKEIRIVGVSQGLTELARDVRAVGQAHAETAKSAEATARVTETASRRMVSVEGAYNRLMGTLDANTRATQQMERAQRTLDRAFEQSIIDTQQYARAMAMLNERYDAATVAARQDAQAVAALRAQINPLAVAQDRLNAELSEYTGLASRGAITARELAAAQATAKTRFDAATASLRAQNAALNDNVPRAGGAFQTGNIAAQFQDIAVTAQMGQSATTIALQQGTQLAAVLNTMEKPLAGIVAGLTSMINPTSLITIGLIAASVAAYKYFSSSEDSAKAVEATFDRHADAIAALKDAYGEAADGAQEYIDKSKEAAVAGVVLSRDDLTKQFESQIDTLVEGGDLVR